MATITQLMRGRPVTHEEAQTSIRRLINSHFHNADSARCSIPVRAEDDDVVASDYVGEQKVAAETTALAHSLAYESAEAIIRSEAIGQNDDGWHHVETEGEVELVDAIRYLALRGLLVWHETNPNWIQILDESEAVAL